MASCLTLTDRPSRNRCVKGQVLYNAPLHSSQASLVLNRTPENTPSGDPEPTNDASERTLRSTTEGAVSLLDLWLILWRAKWQIIGITAIFAALSIPYALMQTEWYRSEVLLAPAEEKSTSGLMQQLGGLVALAGVSVGGGGNTQPLAILRSRDFAASFIEEQDLLPVLYADSWDPVAQSWIGEDPEKRPDMRDAVKYFREKIVTVAEDTGTGLVTLSVVWTDPEIAAEWADLMVRQINDHLRQRELRAAEANIAYLEEELGNTNVFTLQQSIGRLLEAELQKLMLAKGNEEFAFRVIDRANVPKTRFWPNRKLIVVLATFLGGMLSVVAVFATHAVRAARAQAAD